jgi:serine/threonine protein kinase
MILPVGGTVEGKWTKQVFLIERLLGQGANGSVYLVRTTRGLAAMKVCSRAADIALEWGLLQDLQAESVFPKPMLIDDANNRKDSYFYVMEWIEGETLRDGLKRCDVTKFHLIATQILKGLSTLHDAGKTFCDVKPENILISTTAAHSVEARFVDVGGVTPIGRAVRQFTPYYDRGFWGLGTRQADPAYDVCGLALALLLSTVEMPPQELMSKHPHKRQDWLQKTLMQFPFPPYMDVFRAIFSGNVASAREAVDMMERARRQVGSQAHIKSNRRVHSARPHQRSRTRSQQKPMATSHPEWSEWVMWVSICSALIVTTLAWASFLGWL